jgi:hypothetical protein
MGQKNKGFKVRQDFIFSIAYFLSIFSCSNIRLLMSVGTYLCKLLIFVWFNINRTELILNSDWAPNFLQNFWIRQFYKSKKHYPQTHTKRSMKSNQIKLN